VQNNDFFTIEIANKLICFNFGLCEDDCPVFRIVTLNKSKHSLISFTFSHQKRIMLYSL